MLFYCIFLFSQALRAESNKEIDARIAERREADDREFQKIDDSVIFFLLLVLTRASVLDARRYISACFGRILVYTSDAFHAVFTRIYCGRQSTLFSMFWTYIPATLFTHRRIPLLSEPPPPAVPHVPPGVQQRYIVSLSLVANFCRCAPIGL